MKVSFLSPVKGLIRHRRCNSDGDCFLLIKTMFPEPGMLELGRCQARVRILWPLSSTASILASNSFVPSLLFCCEKRTSRKERERMILQRKDRRGLEGNEEVDLSHDDKLAHSLERHFPLGLEEKRLDEVFKRRFQGVLDEKRRRLSPRDKVEWR